MQSPIYYPGFEIRNETWLKFALLYFDRLRPIIPQIPVEEKAYLSETAMRVMHETDLMHPYCPDDEDNQRAFGAAVGELEKYMRRPELCRGIFVRDPAENVVEMWKDPCRQTVRLYAGKITPDFYKFCVENQLASPFEDGIRIAKDPAFLYMSLLADAIAKRWDLEMVTDVRKYDHLLRAGDERAFAGRSHAVTVAKEQIELAMPQELARVPLRTIIELRQDRDFQTLQTAFTEEMRRYVERREAHPEESLKEQLRIRKELYGIIGSVCGAARIVQLLYQSTIMLFDGGTVPVENVLELGGNMLAAHGISQAWQNVGRVRQKRRARRYLDRLRNLPNEP